MPSTVLGAWEAAGKKTDPFALRAWILMDGGAETGDEE